MAYLDYVGLAYFKSLLDENYLRTDYSGDTTIQGNVTFTEPVDADVKNDYLGNQIDKTYIKDIVLDPEGSGALALVLGDGSVSHLLTNTTVSQVRSSANELYPVLLCYDADAEEAQITKTVKYVHDVQINPSTGYISAKGMYIKHPTFNRRNGVSQKVEWSYDFTDGVSGLGNPMSQVYAYVDPAAQGGEHCIELRLYGNPNVSPVVPSINDSTNTFSIGVGVTGGNVQFGYCPSTPLYLDNGSTLRTEATGHGTDIITRDWLNLNGSLTGLVHTTMNETIDGAKTFKKTVTINSGNDSNKAGLYVQGNSDVHGNEHVYGTETVDGKLTANGTAEIKGGSGNTPSLTVTGDEKVTGNSSVTGNSNIGGNEIVNGNISTTNGNISTANGTVSGKTGVIGSGGLTVNGNETVTGEIYKTVNNTPQEYVSYVTNKQETKTTIVNNLIKDKGGLAVDNNKNIYVSVKNGGGIKLDSTTGQLYIDFNAEGADSAAMEAAQAIKDQLLSSLGLQIPLTKNKSVYVDPTNTSASDTWRNSSGVTDTSAGSSSKPFKTIQAAVDFITQGFAIGSSRVTIYVNGYSDSITNRNESSEKYHITNHVITYEESVSLPSYNRTSGYIVLRALDYLHPPIIDKGNNSSSGALSIDGVYNIYRFKLVNNIDYDCAANNRAFPNLVAIGASGDVNIYGCIYECKFLYSSHNNYLELRPINVSGRINFRCFTDNGVGYPHEFYFSKGAASACNVFYLWETGVVDFPYTSTLSDSLYMIAEGDCSTFMVCNGLVRSTGGQDYQPMFKRWDGVDSRFYDYDTTNNPALSATHYHLVSGKKYTVNGGGHCYSPKYGFPGSIAGTDNASTFSVYTGSSDNYDWNSSSTTAVIS